MKNNKGFTLIELIAAVTLIGILAILVFPQIFGLIDRSRKKIYVEDATRLLAKAQYAMSANSNKIEKPNSGQIIIFGMKYLEQGDFENTPNGGVYLQDYSFVAVLNNNSKYYYSVMLVEKTKHGDYRGINLTSENDLHKKDSLNSVVTFEDKSKFKYVDGTTNPIAGTQKLNLSFLKTQLGSADSGVWSSSSSIVRTYYEPE